MRQHLKVGDLRRDKQRRGGGSSQCASVNKEFFGDVENSCLGRLWEQQPDRGGLREKMKKRPWRQDYSCFCLKVC